MKLGSVVKVNPEQARRDYPYEEIEYIDISSVGTGILLETKQLEFANAPSRAKRIVRNGDTILATVRPNLRAFWFAQNIQDNTIASTGFAVLRANEKADSRFIYYTVTNQLFTDYLTANAKGAAYPAVDTETIERADVHLPPLPIQRKIAAILSAYDDLIENNLRRIKILEVMAQNLYREWFVNFRFPGHEDTRFVDSPLGKIPEGWEVKKLAELVTTQYGYTESANSEPIGPKYLRGTDINKKHYIEWASVPYCIINDDNYNKYKLHKGDIVIIRMADPGKVGIVEYDVEAVFASYLVRLKRQSNNFGPYYLFYFLNSERYQGYITGASTGTTRKSASAAVLTDINILIPNTKTSSDFEMNVQQYRCLMNNLLIRNSTLRQTRDLLLPKLISGEVDVSELDIKVPEEVAI